MGNVFIFFFHDMVQSVYSRNGKIFICFTILWSVYDEVQIVSLCKCVQMELSLRLSSCK